MPAGLSFGNLFYLPVVQEIGQAVNADDKRLIADCLRGNNNAFGELVQRYQDRLYSTVYRLVGHVDDAQDIVQEAFLNAYQSLDSFKGDSLFFTWLYRIAFNTAISFKRKQRAAISLDAHRDGEGSSMDPLDTSEYSRPEHALERTEQERRLQEAFNQLSSEHRAVLILKDVEGLKYDMMAEILQVPIGTIRSRLHRARSEMRDLLEKSEKKGVK